jgi:Tol biopolymer transport system component
MWRSTRENADNPWGPLVNVQEINSRYNEAFPCLSADGLTLYFSDWYNWSAAGDRPGGVGYHDLWMCTRASRNDPWGTPVNMGAPLNSGSADISPTISHDGLTFIFASNRSGGGSNYDLWMSTRPAAESAWGAPVNMGPAVNSSVFDTEPYLSTDGLALFFCSDRPGGMGSYDIWLTTRPSQAAAWSPPVNLGPPINTSGIEGIPSLSPDQKTLYFGSDKPGAIGGGGWDVYEVPIVPIVDLNSDGIVDAADMCIIVDYWGTNEPLCDIGPMPWGDGIVDVQDLIVLSEHLFEEIPRTGR